MKIQAHNFTQSIFETILPIDNQLYSKIKKQKLTKEEELQSNYDTPIDKILFNEIKNYLQDYMDSVGKMLNKEKNIIDYMWLEWFAQSLGGLGDTPILECCGEVVGAGSPSNLKWDVSGRWDRRMV